MRDISVAQGSVQNEELSVKELKHQNDALDEALKESFPASDPVAVDFKEVKIAQNTE